MTAVYGRALQHQHPTARPPDVDPVHPQSLAQAEVYHRVMLGPEGIARYDVAHGSPTAEFDTH